MTDNLYPWVYTLNFKIVSPVQVILPPELSIKPEPERLGKLQIFNALYRAMKRESERSVTYILGSLHAPLDKDTAEPLGLNYTFRLSQEATPEQLTMTARSMSAHLTMIMWINGHQTGVIPPL